MDSQRSMNILWGCEGRAKNMVSGYLNLMNNEGFFLIVTVRVVSCKKRQYGGYWLVVRESKEEKFGYTFLHDDESLIVQTLRHPKKSEFFPKVKSPSNQLFS